MSRPTQRTGHRFGPYLLGPLLGRGGMGEVYEATDTVRDRRVALKLLPSDLAADASYRRRFEREARIAAKLTDPHVIPIHDFGEIDGTLFIDMRLVEGEDLSAVIRREGRLTSERAVRIVRQVASALDNAHRSGLIHRDVKPANIMLTGDDFAYLADFGIATRAGDDRLTDDGSAVGSFAYMAPERFEGLDAGPASDLYSLAAVFHESVSGRTLFPGLSISRLIAAHVSQAPTPLSRLVPQIDARVDAVVARALSKTPEDRHLSATIFTNELERALGTGQGVRTTPVGMTQHPTAERSVGDLTTVARPVRRHGRPWLLLAVVAAIAVAVGAFGVKMLSDREPGNTAGTSTSTPSTDLSSSATSSTVAPQRVSFASQTGLTACTMNSQTGVVCTSFRRNYQPPEQAAPGCGWSIALGTGAPTFVCDPETFPTSPEDSKRIGADRRSATRVGVLPVLERGQATALGDYVCSMTVDYVTCHNTSTREGFRIAGSMYRLTP